MKEGVVTLLYKKKRRTPLNVDYKIASKVLAGRLSQIVGSLVGEWQTCAVPGRRITDNLTLLRDLIFYAQSNNLPLAVAGIDIEKAYDRVAHPFLFGVLEQMGFPDKFLRALRNLYADMTSQVLVNGVVSDPFNVNSGVRQGCPLTPVMFYLCNGAPFATRTKG